MYELHVDVHPRAAARTCGTAGLERDHPRLHLAAPSPSRSTSASATEEDDYPIEVVGPLAVLPLEDLRGEARPRVLPQAPASAGGAQPEPADGPGGRPAVLHLDGDEVPPAATSRRCPAAASASSTCATWPTPSSPRSTRGEVYGRHLMGVNMTMDEFFGRLERLTGVPAPRLRLPSKVNVARGEAAGAVAEVRGRRAGAGPAARWTSASTGSGWTPRRPSASWASRRATPTRRCTTRCTTCSRGCPRTMAGHQGAARDLREGLREGRAQPTDQLDHGHRRPSDVRWRPLRHHEGHQHQRDGVAHQQPLPHPSEPGIEPRQRTFLGVSAMGPSSS